jgi:hypothetical protein
MAIDFLQHIHERRAVTDHLFEIVFTTNFLLEINVFGGQTIAQPPHLLVGKTGIKSDCDCARDLFEQSAPQVGVGALPGSHEKECADALPFLGIRRRAIPCPAVA